MAPSLKPTSQPIDLIDSVERCMQHLDSLREYASDGRAKHNSGKKKVVLEEVITRVNSNIQALKAWTAAIRKGRQTTDEEIKTTINAVFDIIVSRVHDAKKALSLRLKPSMFRSNKAKAAEDARLWKELNEIKESIGYLHNQVKTVLRDTPDQIERRTRISEIAQKRPKSYHVFVQAIGQMSEEERRSIQFGTYPLLWEEFPPRLDLNGNVGNADDPGDGKVYNQGSIQQASQVLKAFYDAWSEAAIRADDANPASPDMLRKVGKVPNMARICLVLRGMKQERLLDCFCEASKDDKNLPLKVETMRTIFDPDHADHAKTFSTEQYRAVCRTWNDGEHIKIAEEEPLPLTLINEYGKGSYGSVTRRQHAFTNAFYACKEQNSDEARAHLLREIARLETLGHRHIVQFVKSYQRGNSYGILLKPAATTDLKKLLTRYRRNGFDYDKDSEDRRRDRIVLKPVLLTLFGCLSRGLAHIHGCNIRHKDIKPANILYEKAFGQDQARFLWADFGLAHDFANSGNSKTTSKSRHRYSPRYAAPEIMEEFEARKARGEIEFDESDEDDDDDAPEQSTGGPGSAIGHGRSSDIYSFGIVFLETLSYLIAEGSEPSIPGDFEKCMPGWKNIAGLQAWAKKHIQRLPPQDPLVFLFQVSSKMIAHKPGDRPIISDIVRDLKNQNEQYFCTACLNQPEEPISQAVIAEEQMVEGLENANFLSENKHHVDAAGDYRSIHGHEETLSRGEEPQDLFQFVEPSVKGKEPISKPPEPIFQDDSDTESAESLYQPSISSFGSTRSSLSSNSSLGAIVTPWAAVTELKATFATDEQFSSLCSTAIESPGIGVQRFERNLCRLIKLFAKGLKEEAALDDMAGRATARLISSLARRLATEIARTFTSKDTIQRGMEEAKLSERDRHREIELSLAPYQPDNRELVDDISSDDDADSAEGIEDENEEDITNVLQLQTFILSSNAFKNMRWGLHRFLQPDVLKTISNKMSLELNSKDQHTVTFHVHWNLLKFCEEELEGHYDLASVLTVTGTGDIAFTTTCQDYVGRYWPNTGQDVLLFLESAILQRKHEVHISPDLYISININAWFSPTKDEYAMVYASGSQRDLIHLAQQLAWMSAVFRVPRDGELTYSDVIFEQRGPLEFGLMLMDLQKVKNTGKACWHSLFASSVIARGFPTSDRENEIGIEIPFEVMISLACILYPMDYQGGTILRGMRLTLVPTAYCSDSVQWHCVSSEKDSYLPRANELMEKVPEWFKTPDFELLRTSRTFLGYCRVAEIHLGTSGTDYRRIQRSNAALESTKAAISREFSSSLGVSAKGIMTATWSPKITFPRRLRATTKQINLFFHDRLLRARDQPSIVYDVEKKIGWLVPELCVVLHIAHTWASQQPDIPPDVLKKIPYASVSENGGTAAWDAIMEGKGVELRKDSLDGKPQLFGDVINNVLTALENRKDVAVERDNSVFNFRFATSSGLRGWELIDLANWTYLSDRKEVDMDRKTAGEWGSIAAENPDLMVLFCKGLEPLIRPAKHQKVCRLWTPVPEGRYYLIASVHCLKRLSENCGGTETRPKLTRRLHWHRPQGATLFESCNHGVGNRCNPVQELIEKKARSPGSLEPQGAVMFGKMREAKGICCEPFETPSEDRLDETTATNPSSSQVEESSLVAPAAVLGPNPSLQTKELYDHSSRGGPRRRMLENGSTENGPRAILPLINGTEKPRIFDQQKEPTDYQRTQSENKAIRKP